MARVATVFSVALVLGVRVRGVLGVDGGDRVLLVGCGGQVQGGARLQQHTKQTYRRALRFSIMEGGTNGFDGFMDE